MTLLNFFANLFLYRYESWRINKTKKENNALARKFGKTVRFIDDLLAINDGNEFKKVYKEIYPTKLELKKENSINTETNFLELNIYINENTFHTKIFDKRDEFGFLSTDCLSKQAIFHPGCFQYKQC